MDELPTLDGMVPDRLRPRALKILLENLDVQTDIGFHDFEVGAPQRLLVTVELWLEELEPPPDDQPERACDYDEVRREAIELAGARRYNLQETFAYALYQRLAAMRGVKALRVTTSKPDIYADAQGVGVQYSSFAGTSPGS